MSKGRQTYKSEFLSFHYLPYQDSVVDIIKQNNLTKLVCHDDKIFVMRDSDEFEIYNIDDTTDCFGITRYVSGVWDDDVKSIFIELFKQYATFDIEFKKRSIELEINELQKRLGFNVNIANEFYKNN